MSEENQRKKRADPSADMLSVSNKRRYVAPSIKPEAHLRDITLGGSTGSADSTNPDFTAFGGLSSPKSEKESSESNKSGGIFENDIFGG